MSNEYGAIPLTIANDVGSNLKKKMGSLTGYAPVDWAETINKLGNKLPERTASGAVCSFSDGADDVPMTEVKASITAVQAGSGDPSPSNVRAISGFAECDVTHTKKNLWGGGAMLDSFKSAGISGITYGDGTVSFSGSNVTGKVIPTIKYKENTKYTFILSMSCNLAYDATNLRIYYTDGTSTLIKLPTASADTKQTVVFTSAANKTVDRLQGVNAAGTATLYYNESGLFEGVLTASDYESYAGETIPVSFGGRTIYGGELNLTTGVLTVTHEMVSFKNQSVAWSSNAASTDGYIRFNTPIADKANGYDLLCDTFPVSSSVIPSSPTAESVSGYTNNILYVSIATSRLSGDLSTTAGRRTAFNNWIDANQLNVVYELATPTTIQLTPEEVRSFLGMNNLWANTGDSECTYFAQPNVPEEVLYKGQISTTSDYATANFTGSVADDEEILVKVYCPARSAVDYKVIKVSDIGNGLNVGFSLHTTVNCTITKTSIASYQYSGDYYDIYADVLAYDSAIFN